MGSSVPTSRRGAMWPPSVTTSSGSATAKPIWSTSIPLSQSRLPRTSSSTTTRSRTTPKRTRSRRTHGSPSTTPWPSSSQCGGRRRSRAPRSSTSALASCGQATAEPPSRPCVGTPTPKPCWTSTNGHGSSSCESSWATSIPTADSPRRAAGCCSGWRSATSPRICSPPRRSSPRSRASASRLGSGSWQVAMSEHDGHIELERSVDSIVVGVRHRKNPSEDIEPLMASIKKLGLLQPVTITPDGVLVCGARRLAAVKRLGWRTLKVWVRSGISDDLNRLLAQQDENEQRKPLNQLEQAALFRELRKLINEDAQRRQKASRFGADGRPPGSDGPGESPGPLPGHGDSRHEAAIAVTGKASYNLLEEISAIERIAADRSAPGTLRRLADLELEAIQNGGDVHPAYERIRSAKELIDSDDTPMPTGPVTDEEVDNLAIEAMDLLGQKRGRNRGKRPKPTMGTSGRSLRAFLLTWGDLDGWSRYYNPSEIAAQLKQSDWEMFERVVAETIAFAGEVRDLRSAPTTASA